MQSAETTAASERGAKVRDEREPLMTPSPFEVLHVLIQYSKCFGFLLKELMLNEVKRLVGRFHLHRRALLHTFHPLCICPSRQEEIECVGSSSRVQL